MKTILLTMESDSLILPVNYSNMIQGMIYSLISDDSAYAEAVHDHGFQFEERKYKLFTFGPLKGRSRYADKKLYFSSNLQLEIRFVDDPANKIDKEALTIYGGHAWQKGEMPKLTAQYLYDMQAAVDDILAGKAEWEPYQSGNRMLNANFKHGCATITWNTDFYRALLDNE